MAKSLRTLKLKRRPAQLAERRGPRQERALETIKCISQAAAKVLVARGYARTTTNHIAERAGLSIGSIYQYFADKDAIIAALLIEHCEHSERVFFGALEKLKTEPL